MQINKCKKQSFCVIGKEGCTNDGEGFVQKLWADANGHYGEVQALAKKDDNGNPIGFWGAMSDLKRIFKPWQNNFTEGLYLAGVETDDSAEAPEGWSKWILPAYEYLYVKVENGVDAFGVAIKYMEDNEIELAGAVQEYICPAENGQMYMFFPIKKL